MNVLRNRSRSRISGYEQSPIRLKRLDTEQQHQPAYGLVIGNLGQENSGSHGLVAFEVAEDKLGTFENRVVAIGRLHRPCTIFISGIRELQANDADAPTTKYRLPQAIHKFNFASQTIRAPECSRFPFAEIRA